MKFTLTINCENDAFATDYGYGSSEADYGPVDMDSARPELARLLRQIADKIEDGQRYDMHQNIVDANGNIVGTFAAKDEK